MFQQNFFYRNKLNFEILRLNNNSSLATVWPVWAIYFTWGNFLKPLAITNMSKSPTFKGNFCKGVKIWHFSSEIIFGQLLETFGNFFLVYLHSTHSSCFFNQMTPMFKYSLQQFFIWNVYFLLKDENKRKRGHFIK